MFLVFLSYRRADTGRIAARIHEDLERQFGRDSIFMDVEEIPGGKPWREQIDDALEDCHALVVLIGTRWLEGRRLDDPDDLVRWEIEQALGRDIPVLPLLVGNARMPAEDELPKALSVLVKQQGLPVGSGQTFADTMARVVEDLRRLIGTKTSPRLLLHDELLKLQALIDEPVGDLVFTVSSERGTHPERLGFRLILPGRGSMFCYPRERDLIVEDRRGNAITIAPAIGADIESGSGFYSVDLVAAQDGVPEHGLVGLKLVDLERASIDFMVKRNAPPSRALAYNVGILAVVSNRMVACGSFWLRRIDGPGLPITGEFVSASPFPETLQLNVLSDDVSAEQGEDMDRSVLAQIWARIHAELERVPGLVDAVRLPVRAENVQGVPASVQVAITASRLAEKLGFGEQGSARVLLHESGDRTTQLIGCFDFDEDDRMGAVGEQTGPPNPIAALVAYLLSYWKFLDAGRAQSTVAPLERLVLLWPVSDGTWLWVLEGADLAANWRPEWTSIANDALVVSPEARAGLVRSTRTWRHVAVENS
jgi:hypothetical protein